MSLLVVLFAAVVVLGGIGVAVLLVLTASRAKNPAQITSMPARVLGQREITAGGGVQHWVSFRLSDGREVELQATPSQAYVVYPGQDGTLHFAGERVTGWVPALAGGPKDSHSSD